MIAGIDYLIDTSALQRLFEASSMAQWDDPLQAGVIGLCDITELEYLFSARHLTHRNRARDLLSEMFPWVSMSDRVYARAREVQAELTGRGWHRSAGPVDLLVAATAELSGLTILHQDRDFETVAKVTGQPTAWLRPTG